MAPISLMPMSMTFLDRSASPLISNGKFLFRNGRRFVLAAAKAGDCGTLEDFDSKLRLISHFEELRSEGLNALLLDVNHADKALDLCAIAGLYAIVEMPVNPGEILDRQRLRGAACRLKAAAHNLAGRPALSGFLIDCPLDSATIVHKPSHIRLAMSTLIDAIRESARDDVIIAVRRNLSTLQLAVSGENLTYVGAEWLNLLEIPEALRAARAVADSRPMLVELSGRHLLDSGLLATLSAAEVAGIVYAAGPIAPAGRTAGARSSLGDNGLRA
jgi:hypothetical protein